jgi:hypothetical protein
MKRSSWLGLLVMGWVFASNAADVDACTDCKAAALASASQCHAIAAPDPALRDKCEKQFNDATQACQEGACRLEAGTQLAAQCVDCLKQADVELKKCAMMPPGARAACEAHAATLRKGCDERFCPTPKASERPAAGR